MIRDKGFGFVLLKLINRILNEIKEFHNINVPRGCCISV